VFISYYKHACLDHHCASIPPLRHNYAGWAYRRNKGLLTGGVSFDQKVDRLTCSPTTTGPVLSMILTMLGT
jgi:hypothetical protein